jgi:antitoxin (DNA-binding transcriptional repressor) of toxin-antitoxin stability system
MRRIHVKTLKKKLIEYLRMVTKGETVLVTDGDRVIAELIPPRETGNLLASEGVLTDAIRKGLITPARLPPGIPPPRLPVDLSSNILRELDADRSDR